jgi:hypothetical protein
MVDAADAGARQLSVGVEKPKINATLKEANTTNFRLRIISPLEVAFSLSIRLLHSNLRRHSGI